MRLRIIIKAVAGQGYACVESGKKVKEADFEWSPGMDELGNIEISDLDPTKKYEIYTKKAYNKQADREMPCTKCNKY